MTATPPIDRDDGVYFDPRDYGGFGRRAVCGAIDVTVLLSVWTVMVIAWKLKHLENPEALTPPPALLGLWLLTCFLYMTALKASPLGTAGYWFTGLRVVDLHGRRPSLARMTLRCVPLLMGPGFWLLDLFWVFSNRERRKLSDQFGGTYVVRPWSTPAGSGPVVAAYYDAFGYFLVFGEVRRAAGAERPRLA